MDQLSIGHALARLSSVDDATASFPFENNANQFLSKSGETRWVVKTNKDTVTAVPEKTDGHAWSFQFACPSYHTAPVSGSWYLIPFRTNKYVIGWLVCSTIGNHNEFIFSRVSAGYICYTVNAVTIFENPYTLVRHILEECILINGAKRYSDGNLEEAIICVRNSDQEHIERFHGHAVNRIKQQNFMG